MISRLLVAVLSLSFCCAMAPYTRKGGRNKTPGHPVILVPGDGGSQLEANLTGKPSVVHYLCAKQTSDYFDLWLNLELFTPVVIDCWVDNMQLVYNTSTGTSTNMPGVDIRVPGFGGTTTVEWLDPSKSSTGLYFFNMVDMLVSWGYKRGKDILAVPYDWRKAPNELHDYYLLLKTTIETTYRYNNNKKVVIVGHSMGNPVMLYFYKAYVTQDWKDKYIQSHVGLAAPWGGSMQIVRLFASGYNMNYYRIVLSPNKLRAMQRSFTSSAFLFPSPHAWNSTDILVYTAEKNYTLNNVQEFFTDVKYELGWEQYKNAALLNGDLSAPGVEMHCVFGSGLATPEQFTWTKGWFPDYAPYITNGDGDGTEMSSERRVDTYLENRHRTSVSRTVKTEDRHEKFKNKPKEHRQKKDDDDKIRSSHKRRSSDTRDRYSGSREPSKADTQTRTGSMVDPKKKPKTEVIEAVFVRSYSDLPVEAGSNTPVTSTLPSKNIPSSSKEAQKTNLTACLIENYIKTECDEGNAEVGFQVSQAPHPGQEFSVGRRPVAVAPLSHVAHPFIPPPPPGLPSTPGSSVMSISPQPPPVADQLLPSSSPVPTSKTKPSLCNRYTQTGESLLMPCLKALQMKVDVALEKKRSTTGSTGTLSSTNCAGGAVENSRDSVTRRTTLTPLTTEVEESQTLRDMESAFCVDLAFSIPALRRPGGRYESEPYTLGEYSWTLIVWEDQVRDGRTVLNIARVGIRCTPKFNMCNVWNVETSALIKFRQSDNVYGKFRGLTAVYSSDSPEQYFGQTAPLKMHVLARHYSDQDKNVNVRFHLHLLKDGSRLVGDQHDFLNHYSPMFNFICEMKEGDIYVNKQILMMFSPYFAAEIVDLEVYSNATILRSDFIELLRVIYPEQKPISDDTLCILLSLATDFQFPSVLTKCENFLLSAECKMPLLQKLDLASIHQLPRAQRNCLSQLSSASQAKALSQDPYYSKLCAKAKLVLCDKVLSLN